MALKEAYRKVPLCLCRRYFSKRCWGGSFENASVLVAIGVTEDGYREVIGTAEGLKEDTESWKISLYG